MKWLHLTHRRPTDWKAVLLRHSRPELNQFAKKLGLKNYSHGNKEELVDLIVSTKTSSEIKRIASPSLWNRWHNHVYGWASLVGLVLAIYVLPPFHQPGQQSASPAAPPGEKPPAVQSTPNASTTEQAPQRSEPTVERAKSIVEPSSGRPEHTRAASPSPDVPSGASEPAVETFVLSSRVFDRETQIPLARARVTVLDPDERTLQTEDNGSFVFNVTKKQLGQRITIRVESEGYVTKPISLVVGGEVPNIFLEPKK